MFFKSIYFALFFNFVSSTWLTINDYSITIWDENTANRTEILNEIQVTNYPRKYVRLLNTRIDIYTYDHENQMIYFTMQQGLYGISKYFKYDINQNKIYQTNEIQLFMIDYIQYNKKTKKLYSIIHNSKEDKYLLVEINQQKLEIEKELLDLKDYGRPMSGYYFNTKKQLFTYHAYDSKTSQTVLITLDLSDNTTQRFVRSKIFQYNVYSLAYLESDKSLLSLWQYSFIKPLVIIELNEKTGQQIQNITITPLNERISQGYKPSSIDYENKLLYVLSWSEDLTKTYLSKIHFETMKSDLITITNNNRKDYYIFFKKD